RVRGLDDGQARTGRFRPLDRLAWSWVGRVGLPPLLRRLDRPTRGPWRWHGMHVELLLRRRPGQADDVAARGSSGGKSAGALSGLLPTTIVDRFWGITRPARRSVWCPDRR